MQKDLENKTKIVNKYSKVNQATKKQYEYLYNENIKLKKNLDKYQNYYNVQKQQQLQQQRL